jgi:hypothetical protein
MCNFLSRPQEGPEQIISFRNVACGMEKRPNKSPVSRFPLPNPQPTYALFHNSSVAVCSTKAGATARRTKDAECEGRKDLYTRQPRGSSGTHGPRTCRSTETADRHTTRGATTPSYHFPRGNVWRLPNFIPARARAPQSPSRPLPPPPCPHAQRLPHRAATSPPG